MPQYVLLVLLLLVGLYILGKWFISANPRDVARVLKWLGAILAVFLFFWFLFLRRVDLLIYLAGFLLPVWGIWRARRNRAKALGGPSRGQTSEIKTRYLRMVLDHDSGSMTGEVLTGSFAGRELESLDLTEKIALWRECRAEDAQSAAVLEAYLDRILGPDWRAEAGAEAAGGGEAPRGTAPGAMSEAEALDILGLSRDADAAAVTEAHRRLMQKVHPDHGGSNFLAAKINQAKDLLLSLRS